MLRAAILAPLLILLTSVAPALEQNISSSVVKITTKTTVGGKIFVESATGWAWQKPTQVVTALHAVAGKKFIEVKNRQGQKSTAQIVRVVKQGDLALLQLDKDLGLVPLETGPVQHNSPETFHVVGFPHNIPTLSADRIRFSTSFEGQPVLSHLIGGTKLENLLRSQGYPLPETYIYRLSDTIQPGHSGAPIVRENGIVIGVADGGLKKGTARINWAIPDDHYVAQLDSSSETIPQLPSKQSELFSVKIEIESAMVEAPEIMESGSISDPSGQVTVHKVWNASLEEIYFSLEESDQQDLEDIFEDFSEEEIEYLAQALRYDIYEDYNTGATFAVPEGAEIVYEDEAFAVSLGQFEYDFIPQNTATFEEAVQTVRIFADELLKYYPNALQYEEDDEDGDADEQWYNLAKMRVIEEDGEQKFFAVGGEALGENAALIVFVSPLPEVLDEDQMIRFMGFVVGLEIISFASY